jgi:hypothetical protein
MAVFVWVVLMNSMDFLPVDIIAARIGRGQFLPGASTLPPASTRRSRWR